MTRLINQSAQDMKTLIQRGSDDNLENNSSLKKSVIEPFPNEKLSSLVHQPYLQLFFFQSFAMAILVYGIVCIKNAQSLDLMVCVAVFLALSISVCLCGANLNPSITLSQCLRKQNRYKWNMLPLYSAAQLFGTMFALILGQLINGKVIHAFTPQEQNFMGCFRLLLSETIGTFILVFFILLISNPNTTFINNEISGYLFITIFVHTGRKFAPKSFNCINIVISLGFAIMAASRGHWDGFKFIGLFLLGDTLGAVSATLFYDQMFEPNVIESRRHRRSFSDSEFPTTGSQLHDLNQPTVTNDPAPQTKMTT